MIEDAVLLWKYKHGSRDALHRIYEKYRSDLLTLAVHLSGNIHSAEDIVQDVFISFVQTVDKFHLTGTLRGYLSTCVANRSRDYIKKIKRQQLALNNENEKMISETNNPIHLLIRDEELLRLSIAMTQLPYLQREAIVLYLHGGLKFKQIAKYQKVPIKTAQSRFRCGLEKLRSIFNGEKKNV